MLIFCIPLHSYVEISNSKVTALAGQSLWKVIMPQSKALWIKGQEAPDKTCKRWMAHSYREACERGSIFPRNDMGESYRVTVFGKTCEWIFPFHLPLTEKEKLIKSEVAKHIYRCYVFAQSTSCTGSTVRITAWEGLWKSTITLQNLLDFPFQILKWKIKQLLRRSPDWNPLDLCEWY